MIAARFSSIGWVAGCAAAALCCYLASQGVASERAALARVDRDIAATTSDIRRLNTEIAARGRMGQIERWNSEVLALQAPAPAQFVADEIQLVSLAGGGAPPVDPAIAASRGAVSTVAYQAEAARPVTPAPVPAAQPLLHVATFVHARPAPLDDAPAAPVVKVGLTRIAPAASDTLPARRKPAMVDRRPPAIVAASLLPSDLGSLIAAEKKVARPAYAATTR